MKNSIIFPVHYLLRLALQLFDVTTQKNISVILQVFQEQCQNQTCKTINVRLLRPTWSNMVNNNNPSGRISDARRLRLLSEALTAASIWISGPRQQLL